MLKIIVGEDEGKKSIRNKGTSLIDFPRDYCVLDLETTGLMTDFDHIIEIGILKVRNNKIVDQYQSLIQPDNCSVDDDDKVYWISDFITELTGITNQMLETAPQISEIADDIINFIEGDILVGHNIHFDINFLYDALIKHKNFTLCNDFWDAMRLSRRILPDLDHHRLIDLTQHYNLNYNPHRTINDCIATHEVKLKLEEYIKNSGITVKELYPPKRKAFDLRQLKSENISVDKNNIFYNKYICFTGTLNHFSRKEAAQMAVNLGANAQNTVTKQTNYLILGIQDPLKVKQGKSNKQKKAEIYILDGQDLSIIDEKTFLEMLEN